MDEADEASDRACHAEMAAVVVALDEASSLATRVLED
jgi:hypothetical protein